MSAPAGSQSASGGIYDNGIKWNIGNPFTDDKGDKRWPVSAPVAGGALSNLTESELVSKFPELVNEPNWQNQPPFAVPWETDALYVVGTTILFGFGVWAKRKSAKSIQK